MGIIPYDSPVMSFLDCMGPFTSNDLYIGTTTVYYGTVTGNNLAHNHARIGGSDTS